MHPKRKIGIVGYGRVGRYLVQQIQATNNMDVAFVWNRNAEKIEPSLPRLEQLESVVDCDVDLIVEVAHPDISRKYGTTFLGHADYMAGSPTAFADPTLEESMRFAANQPNGHGLYIPKGALPGLHDILDMVRNNQLVEADITMTKAPESIHYVGSLPQPLEELQNTTTLYQGALRELCHNAPNNVNTMAVLALASGLGFDKVQATLIAKPDLEYHITEVNLWGTKQSTGGRYQLHLCRRNPAAKGAVTGNATYRSFWDSLCRASGQGDGIHFV